MARITVEDCIDKLPSRFELVLVASQRARKLYSGETPTVVTENDKNTVIALREIADSTLTTDEMKENLIQEYQTVTLSDEEDEVFELESSNETTETTNKNEESKSYVSDVEEEMKELVSSEDSEIEEQYEIKDDIEVNTVSDETEENTQSLE